MPKFDMGAAWDDAVLLLKSHSALTGAIASVFLFLPTLAVSWFGPQPIEPAAGATFEQIMQALQATMRQMLPYQLLIALIAAVGGVGIMRLWLARSGTSVSEALGFALKMLPTMIGVQILTGLAMGIGFILLLVPALYLMGRLALVSAFVADRGIANPLTAIGESWSLTKDNGWRIFFFLFLVGLVIGILTLIVAGIVGAAFGTTEGAGLILTGLVEAGFAAVGGLVSAAICAATYRQLALRDADRVFS